MWALNRTKCTGKHQCRECKKDMENGVLLDKRFKHIICNDPPEPTQHDAHCWRAQIISPVTGLEIQPKFKRGKRV
jgi:hypothetical protein